MSKKDFKLGADPEFIILRQDKPFSAEGLIGAGKMDPMDLGNGFAIHEDNILVEVNIPPASNGVEFLRSNLKVLSLIHEKFLKGKELKISKDCYGIYDESQLQTEQAQSVGCSPEFDAMNMEIVIPPVFEKELGRSAGGHIHIGYENENEFESIMIVKMLDLHLGIPSLILDKDTQRRRLYGKASSYRRTPGLKVEYRTLSNFWLFDKILIEWVYNVTAKVVDEVLSGTVMEDELYMRVRNIINTNDKKAAEELIKQYDYLLMPSGEAIDVLDMIYSEDPFFQDFVQDPEGEVLVEEIESPSKFDLYEASIDKQRKSYKPKAVGMEYASINVGTGGTGTNIQYDPPTLNAHNVTPDLFLSDTRYFMIAGTCYIQDGDQYVSQMPPRLSMNDMDYFENTQVGPREHIVGNITYINKGDGFYYKKGFAVKKKPSTAGGQLSNRFLSGIVSPPDINTEAFEHMKQLAKERYNKIITQHQEEFIVYGAPQTAEPVPEEQIPIDEDAVEAIDTSETESTVIPSDTELLWGASLNLKKDIDNMTDEEINALSDEEINNMINKF